MTAEEVLTEVDRNSFKLVLLPNSRSTYTSLKLKNPVGQEIGEYLISQPEGKLYSLNKTDFKDSYNEKQRLTKNSQPLTSLLLTRSVQSASPGCLLIGKAPEIYIATAFNQIYFLLSFFVAFLKQDHLRLLSYDDLMEKFEESETLESLISQGISFKGSLERICDTVEEGGETFHKVSKSKVIEYLKQRVTKIVGNFPASVGSQVTRKLTGNVSSGSLDLTDDIIRLSRTRSAINLLSSYVDDYYLRLLLKEYDFRTLDSYMEQLARIEEMNKVAEDNLQVLNERMNESGGKKRKPVGKKQKVVKRVAVGKGALDMFFKPRS
ncbi:DEKNAAC102875 [Brettanomyces naardenensis]|uniref:DEKNAAC102875 n=1 Tax=Brettanomyces naardenensis TaxID=13370 RepID=A0A448YLV3_BRENA|nr:DEKNAAC102875 [Brettanomyces naardenensis]